MTATDEPRNPPEQPDESAVADTSAQRARAVAERHRRMAEVFGTVLPDATRDDLPESRTGDADAAGLDDRWYADNRPPHHDAG